MATEKNVKDALQLKKNNIPRQLYKYREYNEFSIANLESNSVWLSYPEEFNDPFDCSYKLEGYLHPTDEQFESILQGKTKDYKSQLVQSIKRILKEQEENHTKKMLSFHKKQYNVCSFSERNDSILMWSHYGGFHKGFCIEYDFASHSYIEELSNHIFPVYYDDKIFDATDSMHDKEIVTNRNFICQMALSKSTEWSYEKEWRLVYWYENQPSSQVLNVIQPTCVYLGAKIPREHKLHIAKICQKKGIMLKQMELKTHEFKLRVVEI